MLASDQREPRVSIASQNVLPRLWRLAYAVAMLYIRMPTRDLRFAMDEKGIKNLAPTLVGGPISYWQDTQLLHGRVAAAEVRRDRYGNPYIEVEIEEAKPSSV